ncbi:hypothetical protein R3P38DRAFT_2579582 [Favolaschia claudopus]|uniref:MYND-type domain-containing protein n=1 Tax=Favolaschia claudopus TaxID=2862362 RepID=A0AAV9ZEQ6_9AGAR
MVSAVTVGLTKRPPTAKLFDLIELIEVDLKLEYLPIYYHFLDPRRIPTPEELEEPDIDRHGNLMAALLCINPLFQTRVPPAALPDLWPHLWPWIDFICTYHDFIAERIKWLLLGPTYCRFIFFCSAMWSYERNKDIIASSPRCATPAIRAWASFVEHDDLLDRARQIAVIQAILYDSGAALSDVVDAIDGGLNEIARLVMVQCAPVVPLTPKPATFQVDQKENMWLVEYAVGIVICLDQAIHNSSVESRPLCNALVSLGFVETLTVSSYALSLPSVKKSSRQMSTIRIFLSTLMGMFEGPEGSKALQLSLESGLLNMVLQHAQLSPSDEEVDRYLADLLGHRLPRAMIYYHTLAKCKPLEAILDHGDKTSQLFAVPNLYEAWKTFSELCRERLRAQEVYDSKVSASLRACDNIECGTLLPKKNFKRCAGCSSLLYCSRECQRVDWRSGHRSSCIWHLSNRNRIRVIFSAKEYSFFRFLMQQGYRSQMPTFVEHLLRHWASAPNEVVASLFDYRSGRLDISCFEADLDDAHEVYQSEYYNDIEKRVERSAGRMTLDVMCVPYGLGHRDLIIPLRRETGRMEADLKRIRQSMCTEGHLPPQILGMMENIMREEGRVTR